MEIRNDLKNRVREFLAGTAASSAAENVRNQLVQEIYSFVAEHPFDDSETGIVSGDTKEDALGKICVGHAESRALVEALRAKKRIALEGKPAYGRVFAAQQLAYAFLGEEDPGRVVISQFSSSYSFADFLGLYPLEISFLSDKGLFFRLCSKAAKDSRPYVLIINETAPGKVNEIFTQLADLAENANGQQTLQKLYGLAKPFSVPDNVYIYALTAVTGSNSLPPHSFEARSLHASMQLTELIGVAEMGRHPELQELLGVVEGINSVVSKNLSLGSRYCLRENFMCPCALEGGEDVLTFEMRTDLNPLMTEYCEKWEQIWRDRREDQPEKQTS